MDVWQLLIRMHTESRTQNRWGQALQKAIHVLDLCLNQSSHSPDSQAWESRVGVEVTPPATLASWWPNFILSWLGSF